MSEKPYNDYAPKENPLDALSIHLYSIKAKAGRAHYPDDVTRNATFSPIEGAFAALELMEKRDKAQCSAMTLAREALEGVIRVADRKTAEFDAARAALSAINAELKE